MGMAIHDDPRHTFELQRFAALQNMKMRQRMEASLMEASTDTYTVTAGPPRVTAEQVRHWIIQSMPAFLQETYPDVAMLTILRREGSALARAGWLCVPLDFEIARYDDPAQWTVSILLRCQRYAVRLMHCRGLAVAGRPLDSQRFEQIPRRVHLAMDGALYWSDWEPDTVHVVPGDGLPALGETWEPIVDHAETDAVRQRLAMDRLWAPRFVPSGPPPLKPELWLPKKEQAALAKLKRLASRGNKV